MDVQTSIWSRLAFLRARGTNPRATMGARTRNFYHVVCRSLRLAAVALVATLLATGPTTAQVPLKFSLDFKIEGQATPFLVGIDKGHYKSAGLDVVMDPAAHSLEAIERLAAGSYDMALADINTLIRFRERHPAMPIKAVFMVYNRPPFAIVARRSRGITKPKDLEGKKLGAPAADTTFAQWKVFTKVNNIDASKVTIENVGFPVREPILAAGQVDAITGFSFVSYVDLKERGVPADDLTVLLMADYGVNFYGNAILVNPNFAAAHPEAVTAFLRAFVRSLKDTARDPSAAVESALKRTDGARKEVELERLRMALRDNILTPEVKANGLGAIDMKRLESSIETIASVHEFKSKLHATDIFDSSFLPGVADRKIN
jgi:NitT/TauT family transport system substrate-binding protein